MWKMLEQVPRSRLGKLVQVLFPILKGFGGDNSTDDHDSGGDDDDDETDDDDDHDHDEQ